MSALLRSGQWTKERYFSASGSARVLVGWARNRLALPVAHGGPATRVSGGLREQAGLCGEAHPPLGLSRGCMSLLRLNANKAFSGTVTALPLRGFRELRARLFTVNTPK